MSAVYPDLSSEKFDNHIRDLDKRLQYATRIGDVTNKKDLLEREYNKYDKLYKRCKLFDKVENVSNVVMPIGISLSAGGLITSMTGVGSIVGIPLTSIGLGLAGVSGTTHLLSKYVHNNETRYIRVRDKCENISKDFNSLYHNSMEDQNIDQTEYRKLLTKYEEYIEFKRANRTYRGRLVGT
jgi:hypothetical protein